MYLKSSADSSMCIIFSVGNEEQTHEEELTMLITTQEQPRGNVQLQKQLEIMKTGRCRIELYSTQSGRTFSRGSFYQLVVTLFLLP